mgnify:CR=1 FL=1
MTLRDMLQNYVDTHPPPTKEDFVYNIQQIIRYTIGILFLQATLAMDNISTTSKFICQRWKVIILISVILIAILSYYDFPSAILLAIVLLIQNCYR